MAFASRYRERPAIAFSWNEVTGAVGDVATVLPVVVAVAVLTDLSLPVMLVWFGLFQVVWGLHYGAPVSVEPMKALAALVIAGAISTGELVLAGLLLAAVLLALGTSNSLERIERYVGEPVVRGIQFGVALVLLETGIGLGLGDPRLAIAAGVLAGVVVLGGLLLGRYWELSALAVLLFGAWIAFGQAGVSTPTLPSRSAIVVAPSVEPSLAALEATIAQLAMTVGNAALAAAVLLGDYFDRDVSADELSTSMGLMNAAAVPFGGFPMCHGSGGIAGKYAFGARTAGANLVLGVGYVVIALLGVGLVAAYPLSVLGVILGLVALQLGATAIRGTRAHAIVVGVGVVGLLVNLGVAFVLGVAAHLAYRRFA